MKALACGSRTFWEYHIAKPKLDFCHEVHDFDLLIHGDCRGGDKLAERWAKARGIAVKAVPAQWGLYGKRAGFVRNIAMLDMLEPGDIVIALWDGQSRGTKHTITEALKRGLEVFLVWNRIAIGGGS